MIIVTMVMSELLYESSRVAATNEETSLRTGEVDGLVVNGFGIQIRRA
jgi:hypothetical protein